MTEPHYSSLITPNAAETHLVPLVWVIISIFARVKVDILGSFFYEKVSNILLSVNSCGHLNAVTRLCNLDFVIKMTHYDNNTIIIVIIVIIIIIFITVDG